MRKKIVAGNWKMNLTASAANELFDKVNAIISRNVDVLVAPPFVYLQAFAGKCKNVSIAAQNCSAFDSGAYTGEVSAAMLKSLQVNYVIIGHSERRAYFGETNEILRNKIDLALSNGLQPIYCCGESLEQRESGIEKTVISDQLAQALFHLTSAEITSVIIAYEPVWAIGTGRTATPEQAQEIHAFIRQLLAKQYDEKIAQEITILYGGSCNATNAAQLFANKDVDGGLIGGAALDAASFEFIIQTLENK
jgi:triosephosphate isomerase (TIM)